VIDFDCIVVGSGASGAMAAQTLIEGGARVAMLDAGLRDDRYARLIPEKTFVDIRRTEPEQYRYLLGERFESAAFRRVGAGAQLTPPRRFIVERVDELLRLRAGDFAPLESLAFGGLAAGWGLMCGVYSGSELERASLPEAPMRAAYQTVADRIGICGSGDDDARRFTVGDLARIQPPPPLDPTAALLATRYQRRRAAVNGLGYVLGRPALALLTQPKDGREATRLRDMEFYCDDGGAAWRPAATIARLAAHPNFAYDGGVLVTRFDENDGAIALTAFDLRDGTLRRYGCRRLVLACGVFGTARIVLRSHDEGSHLPLLCNDYTYVPCLVAGRLGRSMPAHAQSLTQLALFHERASADVAVGTIFSYRSLMLFRLLREMPFGVRDARVLMQYLLSGFVIAGFDHPQERTEGKRVWRESDSSSPTGDRLAIAYELTPAERRDHRTRERGFAGVLRTLGAWPLRRVHPPLGSSIHYAGTLPYGDEERPLTLARDGRLHGTRNVFVADASGFTFLPAKPVTLSLMANAHRIADGIARRP
jgi:hypothetical protein